MFSTPQPATQIPVSPTVGAHECAPQPNPIRRLNPAPRPPQLFAIRRPTVAPKRCVAGVPGTASRIVQPTPPCRERAPRRHCSRSSRRQTTTPMLLQPLEPFGSCLVSYRPVPPTFFQRMIRAVEHRPGSVHVPSPGTILFLTLQKTLYLGENPMSKKAAEHHRKASEHLTHAASHHGEAAKHHDAGHHEKAAHHAHTARGHAIHARRHAEDAVMAHTEEHGKK